LPRERSNRYWAEGSIGWGIERRERDGYEKVATIGYDIVYGKNAETQRRGKKKEG